MRPLKSSIVVAAWPKDHNRHRQPYTHMLYRAVVAAAPRLKVLGYRPTRLPPRADLVHVHWPDTTLGHPNPWLAWVLTLRTLILLYVFRLRGALVVWTAHNLSGHNAENRRFLAAVYWWVFSRLVDGVICPSNWVKNSLQGRLSTLPQTVIPIGAGEEYRDVERARQRAHKDGMRSDDKREDGAVRFGFVGRLSPYKGLESLIDAFMARADPKDTLTIAGDPYTANYQNALLERSSGDPRIDIRFGLIATCDFLEEIASLDVMCLPYRDIGHSGVALSSLAVGTPVVTFPVGAMPELQDSVGEDWVYLVRRSLIDDWDLIRSWQQASMSRGSPSLPNWEDIGRTTAAFYQALLSVG